MAAYDPQRSHPAFADDLAASHPARYAVGRYFVSLGYITHVPTHCLRPENDIANRRRYADDGDVFIWVSGCKHVIEVKHRKSLYFDSVESFPMFGSDSSVMVDEVYKYRAPLAYFIVNASRTGSIVIRRNTKPQWIEGSRFDSHKGRAENVYLCPRDLCEWRRL